MHDAQLLTPTSGDGSDLPLPAFGMMMRGAEKQHSSTTTSAMSGVFLEDPATRAEFMRLIRR